MDYESRKVKWYWLLLFLVYCGGVVYLLFQGNPLLYSRAELRSALNVADTSRRLTIPAHPDVVHVSPPTFQARYNIERTAQDPMTGPRSKNFAEYEHFTVDLGVSKFDLQNVSSDPSGFYLSGRSSWVFAVGLDGRVRWKYRFHDAITEHGVLPVLLDQNSAYLVDPHGAMVCLDKMSGAIRWMQSLKEDVVAAPFLLHNNLVIPTKSAGTTEMSLVNRQTGQIEDESPHLDIKPGFLLSQSQSLDVLIATVDNKVMAVEPEGFQVQWTQSMTDPIKGPAVVVGSQIYVTTLGAKLVKLDGTRKGKVDWEADLVKPPAGAATFLPIMNRFAVLDASGSISVVDAKTGKVNGRFSAENHNPLGETWSARLKGSHIEEYKMDWLQKGWTIWTPCYDSAFCIYTPSKTQLISRINLKGRPVALPLAVDRRWVFLGQNKAGEFIISNVLEEGEIKKLRASNAPPGSAPPPQNP